MIRILIITQDDPFYVPQFFRVFVERKPAEIDVEGVVIQVPLGKKSMRVLAKQMLDLYGAGDFFLMGVRYTFLKIGNLIARRMFRGRIFGVYSLEHSLLKKNWSIIRVQNVNAPEFLERVRKMNLDLIVSVAVSEKFRPELLAIPRYGGINVHNARLPKNRGMMPNFWSLYRYDTEPISAITVHRMNENLDDGPIILQEEFRLDPTESLHDLIIRTKRLSADVMLNAILMHREGLPPSQRNDSSQATYNRFPTKEDVRRFRAKGLKLL